MSSELITRLVIVAHTLFAGLAVGLYAHDGSPLFAGMGAYLGVMALVMAIRD